MTDIPLELVIIMIILAIVVPIIIAAFYSYSRDQQLLGLQGQANNVANTAVEVFDDGINTTLLLTISVPYGNGVNFTIGAPLFPANVTSGTPNSQATFIYYALSGTSPYYTQANNGAGNLYLSGLTCGKGGALAYAWIILSGGTHQLSFTKLGPGAYYCSQPVDFPFVGVTRIT